MTPRRNTPIRALAEAPEIPQAPLHRRAEVFLVDAEAVDEGMDVPSTPSRSREDVIRDRPPGTRDEEDIDSPGGNALDVCEEDFCRDAGEAEEAHGCLEHPRSAGAGRRLTTMVGRPPDPAVMREGRLEADVGGTVDPF